MRPFCPLAIFACCALLTAPAVAAPTEREVPLSTVAREAHLEYSWLTAASAVQLTGPGIVVIVRPGDNLYEINDRVESTTTAPRYASNDIYVSAGLATRIEQYARKAWLAFNNAIAARERMEAEAQTSLAELHGTIVMNVQPLKGAEALLVTGTAPPLAPVRVTLLATLSSDLPNVLVGRHDLAADPDGKFQAIIPIGPDYIRNSYLNVLATSGPGVTPANAQILIGPPNPELKVPWETFPGGIW